MQRIYLSDFDSQSEIIQIKDTEIIHQLTKVLRSRIGDKISIFNGKDSQDHIFEIIELAKREISIKKESHLENNSEISFELSLYNGMPNKLEKVEYMLQKGTEIGFTKFCFFRTERSQKLNLSPNKIQRLEKIIIEAAEQSGRAKIPELIFEEDFDIQHLPEWENIFFHTKNDKSIEINKIDPKIDSKINLFVGPEGGWSDSEVEILETQTHRVHLGNRILRTETTWIVTGFFLIQKSA